ncbi:MAG: DMT family transporter [Succiniclasticum sp.]|jgi:drug/metabolite transporter (DMT)-like permease
MNSLAGTLLLVFSTAVWGISGVCGQYLFETWHPDPTWLIMVRQLVAGLIFLCLIAVRRKEPFFGVWRSGTVVVREMVLFTLGLLGAQYGFYMGISLSNAPTATVLIYTEPVFILLYQLLFQHIRPDGKELLGIALAIGGVFLICTHGNPGNLVLSLQALAWTLVSAVSMAVYSICPTHLMKQFSSGYIIGWGQFLAGAILLPFCNLFESGASAWPLPAVGAMAYIIVLGTVIPFVTYLMGLKIVGPVHAALISCCEPLCSILFSVCFLGTVLQLPDYVGMACVIATVLLLAIPRK